MERRDRHTLLTVSAGDQPPLWLSYRMSRQMWPLLYMCGCMGEGGMYNTCISPDMRLCKTLCTCACYARSVRTAKRQLLGLSHCLEGHTSMLLRPKQLAGLHCPAQEHNRAALQRMSLLIAENLEAKRQGHGRVTSGGSRGYLSVKLIASLQTGELLHCQGLSI